MNKEQESKIRDILVNGLENTKIADNIRYPSNKMRREYRDIIIKICKQIANVFDDAEIDNDYKQSKRD